MWLAIIMVYLYAQSITQNDVFIIPSEIPQEYVFERTLPQEGRSADVAYLQLCIARDPELAFEGMVNGFFDRATFEALVRFQEKYATDILAPVGLTKGTGIVSKRTQDRLNSVCGKRADPSLFDVALAPTRRNESSSLWIWMMGILLFCAFGAGAAGAARVVWRARK